MFYSFLKRTGKYIIKGIPNNIVNANIKLLFPEKKLSDKNIIITGGSRGLGFTMAKKLVSEGANVIITGRNEKVLQKSAADIDCNYVKFDINNINSHRELIEIAHDRIGEINCLINNAGISLHESSFLDVTEEQFDAQFDTNLKSAYFLTQTYIKYLFEIQSKGNILFISSERGETVEVLPYGLTKAAITSFVKGLAARYIQKGIRVNGIAPGVTASEMTGFDPKGNLYCDYNITQRVYLPEEVAEIAAFLLSDASAIINGQILVCNEGKTLNV